jgi:hypothetical protein
MADRFERAHGELTFIAERCSDAEWQARCVAEGWPVGTTVHHVAADYPDLLDVLQAISTGAPPPSVTREELEQRNARHARESARLTRGEVLALLRRNGEAITALIHGLDTQQLDRTGRVLGQDVSGAQVIESWMIGHIRTHVASIRAAIDLND